MCIIICLLRFAVVLEQYGYQIPQLHAYYIENSIEAAFDRVFDDQKCLWVRHLGVDSGYLPVQVE